MFFGDHLFVNAPLNRTNREIKARPTDLMVFNLKLTSLIGGSICGCGLAIRQKTRTQAHELDLCHLRQGPEP